MGSHECPYCHYRFEDAESLGRHLGEGDGCPEGPGVPDPADEKEDHA